DVILKDKRAYIFENALNHGSLISKEIIDLTEKYSQRVLTLNKLKDIKEDSFFELLGAKAILFQRISPIESRNLKIANKLFFEKEGVKFKFTFEDFLKIDFSPLTANISNNQLVSTTEMTNFPSLGFVMELPNDERAVVVLDGDVLESIISSEKIFKNVLIDAEGKNFFTQKTESIFTTLLKEQRAEKGVITTKLGGEEILLGFTKLPNLGLSIINFVSSKKAFGVTKVLFERTAYFGLSLLFLFFIFGLLFSITLTRPITKLSDATARVSEGDFTEPVTIKTRDEFKVLSDSFNHMMSTINDLLLEKQDMIDELNLANEKLEDYSKNLEQMVAQRTEELRKANSFLEAMINSLDQGLIVFGEDKICKDVYTQASVELFGVEPSGKEFLEVVGKEDQKTSLEKWMSILFSEMIPFDSAKGLGPSSIQQGESIHSSNFKFIALNYYPMRSDEGKIENIVTVATDMTEEVIAKQKNKERESFVNMVLKLTNNREQFFSFLDEIDEIILDVQNILNDSEFDPDALDIKMLLIHYHTMNGGFGLFSVTKIQEHARSIEQKILDLKDQDIPHKEKHKQIKEAALSMEVIVEEFKESLVAVFGKDIESIKTKHEYEGKDVEKFRKLLVKYSHPKVVAKYEQMFIFSPVKSFFSGYEDLVKTMSQKLGKEVYPLQLKNAELRIPAEPYKDFFSTLVHLFRNCMDHGIESNAKRAELGKDPKGKITVDFKLDDDKTFEVVVADDGGGINPEIIRERLKEKTGEEFDDVSDDQIIYKIFDPEFSTRDEVTEFSGRGVGMSAIKEIVDEKGGKIILESKVGEGSKFTFKLPYS
ncbi:MAG: HAMP domain-containing protein, partial [Deltaproteobacteria bacterium]